MSIHDRLTRLLPVAFLFVFLLSGCLGGDDDVEAPTDDESNGEGEQENGSGFESGDDPIDENGNATNENGSGDENGASEEDECTLNMESVTSFSHDGLAMPGLEGDPLDDPTILIAEISNETFTIDEGTQSLVITAMAGDHVTLGWEVSLLDPSGAAAYSFTGDPGPGIEGVTGDPIQETGSVSSPTPGVWTLYAAVTGFVAGLELQVDANVCR